VYLSLIWALTDGEGFRVPIPEAPLGDNKNIIMTQRLQQCWSQDIVTVVPTGNGGQASDFLDLNTPQRLGTPGSGLITVGGVSYNGVLWPKTTPDRGLGGSISVYAASVMVIMASYTSDTGTDTDDGTSFAAPAVVSGPYTAPHFC
jgi:hypothetical protein